MRRKNVVARQCAAHALERRSSARGPMLVWTAFALTATIWRKRRLDMTVIMHKRRAVEPMGSHELDSISDDLAQSRLMNTIRNSSSEIEGAVIDSQKKIIHNQECAYSAIR